MNTNKSRLMVAAAALVAVAASIGTGTAAHAQDTQKVQKPFSVKLGLYFPSDSDVKDVFGSTWFSGGLSYDIAKSKATSPTLFQIYFDYTSKTKSYFGTDLTARVLGIGPAAKFLLGSATSDAQPYVGAGLGYYDVKGSGGGSNSSDSRFGGKLFGGYQLKSGFFGEADYTYISKVQGVQLGGFGLRAGYRF